MSPIWIPWFLFWAVVVYVILIMFRSASRHDRLLGFLEEFEDWESATLDAFSRQVETWENEGVSTQFDSDMRKAALITLRRRQEENFED